MRAGRRAPRSGTGSCPSGRVARPRSAVRRAAPSAPARDRDEAPLDAFLAVTELETERARAAREALAEAVAFAAKFLDANRVYHVEPEPRLVIVTSPDGANRVYDARARRFERRDAEGRVVDAEGRAWRVTEDALVATFDAALELPRVPAHRAFWFGWYAQHPDTRLIGADA